MSRPKTPGDEFDEKAKRAKIPAAIPRKHRKLWRQHFARNLRDGYDEFGSYWHAIRACGVDAKAATGKPMPYLMLY